MYKVFLVEDEIVVREGIRNNIPWDETPYTLAGEAPDGEIALSMIQDLKPDILITDIRMPFMDGLALSRIVKKTLPWIKILILSGHDEFEYAREAISIGVEEYLLKPLSSRDMLTALDKIARRIDEEKEKVLNMEHLRRQVLSHADILRERWLQDFVSGKIPAAEAIEKGRELGIGDLLARSYTVAVVVVVPPEGAGAKLLPVKSIIRSIIDTYPNVIFFQKDEKKHILLIKEGADAVSANSVEDAVYAIAQAVKYEVERNTACKIAVGIGPAASRLGEVSKSYFRAEQIACHQAALGRMQIADSAAIPAGEDMVDKAGRLTLDGDVLLAKFRYASKKDIDALIREYTGPLRDNGEENSFLEYFILGEIVVAASKIVEELNGDIKTVLPFGLGQAELQEITSSRDIFYGKLRDLFTAVIEFRDSRVEGRYQSVILKAREYIDGHYRDQNISLPTVAGHVGISPNHLSTVFSQETGENFIEYLTRVRIERAKHLLSATSMKSADIAVETGFNDPHYFSFIFKKNTGLSPREYRSGKK
ncbi:MAG: response regulator transcription factor [Treponema sp.]|jgi:two-component system response regulator YesN|nr:response regulator transcription factor [Treponema sp.]